MVMRWLKNGILHNKKALQSIIISVVYEKDNVYSGFDGFRFNSL